MIERGEAPWSAEAIRELYEASSPVMQRVQAILAERPDTELTASELAAVLGISRQTLAGAVGAYSGLVYRRYGRYHWPFSVRRDQSVRQTYYAMPASVAPHVLAASSPQAVQPARG